MVDINISIADLTYQVRAPYQVTGILLSLNFY